MKTKDKNEWVETSTKNLYWHISNQYVPKIISNLEEKDFRNVCSITHNFAVKN